MLLAMIMPMASHGVIYDWTDGTRKLRLNIPDSVTAVRGILINGNGAGGDSTGSATSAHLVAIAESIDFAVLATGRWSRFAYTSDWEIEYFESQIAQFAIDSGHPELVHAPWLPTGHSNGGQMSYGMNAKRPHKVIAFITSKGCCYNTFFPDEAALATPGMLIAGELDSQVRRDNIKALFDNNRPRGALWAWTVEQATGHENGNGDDLKLSFLLECYRLRYPMDQSPVDGPVTLKRLNEYDGWLVDQDSWTDGVTQIQRQMDYDGDTRTLGWVPNERIARIYQAFSSYNKVSTSASIGSNVRTTKTNLTYTAFLNTADWQKIEFYEGATKLGEATGGGFTNPSITFFADEARLYLVHAVVTLSNDEQRATFLRRVFVKGDPVIDPYTLWANENLPEGERAADHILFGGDMTNLQRYAFDLGVGQVDFGHLPRVTTTTMPGLGSIRAVKFRINQDAVDAGLLVMPQISLDLESWTDVSDPIFLASPIAWREGEDVYIFAEGPDISSLFTRVNVERSF
ncbi:MAG: hypothetical protein AAFX93_18390 [Verrucomicrobiota bacterium]